MKYNRLHYIGRYPNDRYITIMRYSPKLERR
jgi:hypothetical protein